MEDSYQRKQRTKQALKTRKQAKEKNRRQRIANSLEELKQLLHGTPRPETRKIDKIEILESAVRKLKEKCSSELFEAFIQFARPQSARSRIQVLVVSDVTGKFLDEKESYRAGYNACLVEFTRYLMSATCLDYHAKANLLNGVSKLAKQTINIMATYNQCDISGLTSVGNPGLMNADKGNTSQVGQELNMTGNHQTKHNDDSLTVPRTNLNGIMIDTTANHRMPLGQIENKREPVQKRKLKDTPERQVKKPKVSSDPSFNVAQNHQTLNHASNLATVSAGISTLPFNDTIITQHNHSNAKQDSSNQSSNSQSNYQKHTFPFSYNSQESVSNEVTTLHSVNDFITDTMNGCINSSHLNANGNNNILYINNNMMNNVSIVTPNTQCKPQTSFPLQSQNIRQQMCAPQLLLLTNHKPILTHRLPNHKPILQPILTHSKPVAQQISTKQRQAENISNHENNALQQRVSTNSNQGASNFSYIKLLQDAGKQTQNTGNKQLSRPWNHAEDQNIWKAGNYANQYNNQLGMIPTESNDEYVLPPLSSFLQQFYEFID